ncbi:uncharacterized protein LOC129409746 [Boleophthalmus pectinirostris]|uniref:uncharacterized protein LOC129409746 n=1 Tax=Boleophthalmus pectinirostris TaxID=150288 RepID=UPI00242DB010|nr:uncharacterized protein LOC129409746 [Boleophthalmus pectinirostris]
MDEREETLCCLQDQSKKQSLRRSGNIMKNKIADSKADITGHQFSGRETMDKTNYSLTLKELKTTDSGDFTFISQGTSGQRPTYCIKLVVQEVLTLTPTVTVINITQTTNSSCVVLTQCSSEFHKDVSYRWTVNNRNYNGPMLEYPLTSQDGTITVICTVSNMVSEVSESKSINCQSTKGNDTVNSNGPIIIAGLVCAVILLTLIVVCWYKKTTERCQNSDAENDPEDSPADNQQQLYSSLLHSDVNVYEPIRGSNSKDAEETSDYANVNIS